MKKNMYDTKELKNILINSFIMPSEIFFWKKISNCIKTTIKTRMKENHMHEYDIKQAAFSDFIDFLQQMKSAKKRLLFNSDDESDDDEKIFLGESEKDNQIKIIKSIGNVTTENLNGGIAADSFFVNQEDKEGIERVVSRIQSIDKNKTFKFKKSQNDNQIKDKSLFETKVTSFPVAEFVNKASHLISLLITSVTDSKKTRTNNVSYPFSLLSANLLIDCSSNIPEANKTFNVLLLTAFACALHILKIPYEIGVVADQQFRFILKSFDEPHSIQALQRVLDCVLIQRYKTNYPDTFHHAIENMICPDETRTQRAIFLFSDGLDENIALVDAWKKQVLNNPSISFGLIATTPQIMDKDSRQMMESIWDSFSQGTKDSVSTTRIAVIDSNLNNKTNLTNISSCFKDVMSRELNVQSSYKQPENQKPNFDYDFPDLKSNEFIIYESNEKTTQEIFVSIENSTETRKSNESNKNELDVSYYKDKGQKIASCKVNKEILKTYKNFIHRITIEQNQIFHLQLMKSKIKLNNGIIIVIDTSISCFNFIESIHSVKTVINILSALSSVRIPYVNIILATENEPIILCNNIPSVEALSEKSPVWAALLSYLLQHSLNECNLEAGIQAAYDLHRMKGMNKSSNLFVLTDGLYMDERKNKIKEEVITATQLGMNVIGIGIGMYPLGITDIFQQSVFSPNPNNVIQAILCCFGGDNPNPLEVISPLFPDIEPYESNILVINKFKKYEENPVFRELKETLQQVPAAIDAFTDVYNEEQELEGKDYKEISNPEGKNTEMYVEKILEGQKILIVMLYNCDLNLEESPNVDKKYLRMNPDPSKEECVLKAVDFFGIDIVVVEDYDDAINELMKRENGKCIYYATWVISGWKYDNIPNEKNAHHVIAFTQCLLRFWHSGGSVVLFAEGEPLTFQANYFLEQITFPDGSKTDLRLKGSHEGKGILYGDDEGDLSKKSVFNRSSLEFTKCQRSSLAHNLVQIYEGETISYADCDPDVYKPFIPFSKDSESGISALFYPFDIENNTGDIIIDCGYTKLFDKMTANGTFKYVQNIAGWTAHVEYSLSKHIKPKDYRPDGFEFNIEEYINETYEFDEMPNDLYTGDYLFNIEVEKMQTLFAVDYSGSTCGENYYYSIVKSIFDEKYKEGDLIVVWGSYANKIGYNTMMEICEKQNGDGGGTSPEEIIYLIINSNPKIQAEHLVIITDGCISSYSVSYCINLVESNKISFKMVDTYVIGEYGDQSVGTVFQKESPSTTYIYKPSQSEPSIEVVSRRDIRVFDRITDIDTLSKFEEKFDTLFKVIKTKMMGKDSNEELESQLQEIKRKITENGESTPDFERKINALIKMSTGAIKTIFNNKDITAMLK